VTESWGADRTARLFASLPDPVFVIDAAGTLVFASEAVPKALGWEIDEWLGRNALEVVHPDDLEMALVSLDSIGDKDVGSPIDIRLQTSDGSWRYFEMVGANLLDDPEIAGIVVAARDLTERRRFEVATNDSDRFRLLVQNSAAITMLLDGRGHITSVSGAFARILGHDPEFAIGEPLLRYVVDAQHARVSAAMLDASLTPGTTTFEATLHHRDGEQTIPLELSAVNLLDDPVVQGLVVTAYDITPLREAQDSLQYLASHDPLTDLANRSLLVERLDDALRRTPEDGPVTVFFIDLDRFKPVNDLLGHEAGDRLLVEVASRLRTVARGDDTVARIGGDEFVVVAERVGTPATAKAIAKRIEKALAAPVELGAGPAQVFASVGTARSDEKSTSESLLADADGAMYLVKAERRGDIRKTVVRVSERRALAEGLVTALAEDQLRVYYQPVISLNRGAIDGVEALVRWEHPERGLLHPGDFIAIAEEAGLDIPLGKVVLQQACEQLSRWRSGGVGDSFSVSVNMSAAQLADREFPDVVREILRDTDVPPSCICLEITERDALERVGRSSDLPANASLTALRDVGVKLAIDDFGTGYSSLTHLRRFPIDVLKVDRSFVNGLGTNRNDTSIVRAVVSLARAMDLTTVAEGVERLEQVDQLAAMGCDRIQGFLYGRAVPANELAERLLVPVGV
jgi:diguanylate cyclase (GGDEF)-like protein/PAS domain S-box-containing protein